MQSLAWYVNRLRCMSVAEVAFRAGKSARELASRLNFVEAPVPVALPAAAHATLPWIAASSSLDTRAYQQAADRIRVGRYTYFDLDDVELGRPPRWNRDPLTGIEAPLRRAATLDYRDQRIVGNIKYLWEPNRHLHLVTLAQAYALTRDECYANEIRRQIESWIEQCPCPYGPNWASSLELGIRLINWSICWQLLRSAGSTVFEHDSGKAFRDAWLRSIFLHSRHIVRNLSGFSSANNHLIGEAAGVHVASVTWPYWPQLREWGDQCKSILHREALRQNAPDGGNREQAISYQQFVLDFLLISGLAARRNGEDFPSDYWAQIEAMIDFLASMMDVGGNVPMIGDADDGYVVRLSQEQGHCPYGSLIATGAVLFDRPDLATKARHFDEKSKWLCAEGGEECFAALLARDCPYRPRRVFPDSGYVILGDRFETAGEVRLIADAGPLGYLSLAAHGHADALAIVLSVAGDEVLIDPGTFCYHTDPEWRRYFRGTAAHNTVSVDNEDQSLQLGNFMWSDHAMPREVEFHPDQTVQQFMGAHDGYRRLKDPVIHRREIRYDPRQSAFEVLDTIECAGPHEVVRHWHFAEGLTLDDSNGSCTVRTASAVVTLKSLGAPGVKELLHGSVAPRGGWVSRAFGVRVPAYTLRWRDNILGTTVLRTRIGCRITRAGV